MKFGKKFYLISFDFKNVKKKERSAINITCSKYLVPNKREADGETKRWGEKKIAKVNTDSDNKKKK